MNRSRDIGAGAATILLALAAWEVAIVAGFGNRALLPPPSAILAVVVQVLVNGDIWGPITVTLGRLLAGLGIATVVGTVLGILTGTSQIVEEIVEPSLEALRSLPKVALVPPTLSVLPSPAYFRSGSTSLPAYAVSIPSCMTARSCWEWDDYRGCRKSFCLRCFLTSSLASALRWASALLLQSFLR
jgi:hypothetical protein